MALELPCVNLQGGLLDGISLCVRQCLCHYCGDSAMCWKLLEPLRMTAFTSPDLKKTAGRDAMLILTPAAPVTSSRTVSSRSSRRIRFWNCQ